MALILDRPEFAPANLTAFGRTVAAESDNDVLAEIFPNEKINTLTYSWTNNTLPYTEAVYRSSDAETKIGSGQSDQEVVTGRLAHLGLKLNYSEDDALEAASGGQSKQARIDELAGAVALAVVRKQQRMRAEALLTGKLAINERGFVQNIDYQRDASLTTTAATLWSDPSADPIEYSQLFLDAMLPLSEMEIDKMLVSPRVMGLLRRSGAVKAQAGALGAMASNEQVQDVFGENGLPIPTVYKGRLNGEILLPDDRVFFAASGAGRTIYGPVAAAVNPRSRIADSRGIFVGAYEQDDADNVWVKSDATAMPVLGMANATAAVKVV